MELILMISDDRVEADCDQTRLNRFQGSLIVRVGNNLGADSRPNIAILTVTS